MPDEKIADLIERVERLDGPDRHTDGDLWWLLWLNDETRQHFDRTGYVSKVIAREGSPGKALGQFFDSSDPACLANLAFEMKFTASLDAALALVERVRRERRDVHGWTRGLLEQAIIRAWQWTRDRDLSYEGWIKLLPLAVLSALLRSIQGA